MLLNDPKWALESLSFYVVFIEPIGINILLLILGAWLVWGRSKPTFALQTLGLGWMVFISPIILFVFFLIAVFSIDFPLNMIDAIIILVLLPTILISSEAIASSRKNGLSIGGLTRKNWVGALIGLSVFLILLGLAVNIYIENSRIFGNAYTNMRWSYYYNESKTMNAMWAFGFLFPFINLFHPIGTIGLLGILAPAMFAFNGMIWQGGQKIYAALISIHVLVLYAAFPIVIAVVDAGI